MRRLTDNTKKRRSKNNGLFTLRAYLAMGLILCIGVLAFLLNTRAPTVDKVLYALAGVYSPGFGQEVKSSSRISIERTSIDAGVSEGVRLELKNAGQYTSPMLLYTDEPTILIYHTHTLEAYTPADKYPGSDSDKDWRTDDNTQNIVAVGEALAKALRARGFNVLHDTTNHEPPKLSTSYTRSEETMKRYKREYPSLTMFIDLHRDAIGKTGATDYCVINGVKTARVMFVVGTGEGATGTGFGEMPDFESNYALARALTDYLGAINPKLVRDVRVKTGRYNQHISNQCILIEVGQTMNTLEQALLAVEHIANAIETVCGS